MFASHGECNSLGHATAPFLSQIGTLGLQARNLGPDAVHRGVVADADVLMV